MTVADLARSCLAYPNVRVADAPTTLPDGAWIIRNCIWGALAEMYDVAPELFRLAKQGGVLEAPLETTIGVSSVSNYTGVYAVDSTPRGSFCTFRITGEEHDITVMDWNSSVGREVEFAPGYLGATGEPAVTIYHDAFAIRAESQGGLNPSTDAVQQNNMRIGNKAWVNGEPITRVADREQARSQESHDVGRSATGEPCYWWQEQRNGQDYICFYPMPTERTAIAFEVFYGMASIAEGDIYTSTITFDLDEKHRREILLPLTVEKLLATPIFANPRCTEQVAKDAAAARNRLSDVATKKPREPDFLPPRWR